MRRSQMKNSLSLNTVLVLLVMMGLVGVQRGWSQERQKKEQRESETFVKKAEKAKKEGNFVQAEANYRRATGKQYANPKASYNLGHLYEDKEMDADGMSQLLKTIKSSKDRSLRHKAFHNMGNAYMKQEDYAQAVNAYKDALRNDPTDDETRYNLAIAKKKLEENPDQNSSDQEDQDDQDKDQDNSQQDQESQDQEQDDEDQENQDGDQGDDQQDDDQNKDKEDGEDQEDPSGGGKDDDQQNPDQNEDQQDHPDENQEQQPQGDRSAQGISDEQAESLLKAAENLEKGVQEKLNEEKGKEVKGTPNRKYW